MAHEIAEFTQQLHGGSGGGVADLSHRGIREVVDIERLVGDDPAPGRDHRDERVGKVATASRVAGDDGESGSDLGGLISDVVSELVDTSDQGGGEERRAVVDPEHDDVGS